MSIPLSDPQIRAALKGLDTVDLVSQLVQAREEAHRLHLKLDEMQQQDPVTGLPNRHRLMDRTEQAILLADRRERHAGLLALEVDQIHALEKVLEFAELDALWVQMTKRIAAHLAVGDTLARVGSDRFGILLPELSDSFEAMGLAESLLEALRIPFRMGGREYRLTVSIGLSLSPQDGMGAELLQRNAESALLRAREEGGDCVRCTTPTLSEASLERKELETCLGSAMGRGEFRVMYQPLFTPQGAILGMEALVRWTHPLLGAVPPSKFIPMAEETHLIHALGEWVLETACGQAASWQALSPLPLRLAVNASPLQLAHPRWIQAVARILRESRLRPSCLEIEITEGTLLKHGKPGQSTLHQLRDMGVRVAIDDFGTGYSALSYLQRLPITTLKIDQSFVQGLHPEHPDDSSWPIVQTIANLGRNLHLDVVAEGVETPKQLELLRTTSCDALQGFLLGRPMEPQDLQVRLETQQARAFKSLLPDPTIPTLDLDRG